MTYPPGRALSTGIRDTCAKCHGYLAQVSVVCLGSLRTHAAAVRNYLLFSVSFILSLQRPGMRIVVPRAVHRGTAANGNSTFHVTIRLATADVMVV